MSVACGLLGPKVRTDCTVSMTALTVEAQVGGDVTPYVGCAMEFEFAKVVSTTDDGWLQVRGPIPTFIRADRDYPDGSVIYRGEGGDHTWVQFLGIDKFSTVKGGTTTGLTFRFIDPPKG